MNKGNMSIKESVKYSTKTRQEITDRILREYKILKDKDPNGMTFAAHMLKVLTDAGYKSPDGSPLTLRGIRYQVLRSGIGFEGSRLRKGPIDLPTVTPKLAPQAGKQDVLQAIRKVPDLLERILRDTTVTPEQRVGLVKAWFELEK